MNEPTKKVMPKGGRKGGAVFPRLSLSEALKYSKKLVPKSHTGRVTKDVLYSGVLGAKSGTGNVRASALRQYSLMVGDQKTNYGASDLAKKIAFAPPEELVPLYREAALAPAIFKKLFDTFHGDVYTRAKIKQRAADLNIHPEEADSCVDIYVKSMELAKLVTVDGDKISHVANVNVIDDGASVDADDAEEESADGDVIGESDAEEGGAEGAQDGGEEEAVGSGAAATKPRKAPAIGGVASKAVINVSVALDSTTDSEKLEKQLALLKRYGLL